jgi:hypothetical protein
MEQKLNDLIRTRTHDLLSCGIVLHHVPKIPKGEEWRKVPAFEPKETLDWSILREKEWSI